MSDSTSAICIVKERLEAVAQLIDDWREEWGVAPAIPLPEEVVRQFEERYAITLPDEYRAFILRVGFLERLVPLAEVDTSADLPDWLGLPHIHTPLDGKEAPGFYSDAPSTSEADYQAAVDEGSDLSYDDWLEVMDETWNEGILADFDVYTAGLTPWIRCGTIVLTKASDVPGGAGAVLAVTGPERGQVWKVEDCVVYADYSGSGGPERVGSFFDWLEEQVQSYW